MNTLTRKPKKTMSIPCNHTYFEVDPDGTIECTECGLRNSLSEVVKSFTCDVCYTETINKKDEYDNIYCDDCKAMGETCRNGKPWDQCTCC